MDKQCEVEILETAEAQKLSMKRIAYRRVFCEKWIERNRMDVMAI